MAIIAMVLGPSSLDQVAYHDWGVARALLVFALCLVRVLLGPALGVLHLAASSIEAAPHAFIGVSWLFHWFLHGFCC